MSSGEFDVIERYFSSRVPGNGPAVALGPGDDCAIVDVPEDEQLCLSTDTLIEGVHLPPGVSGAVAAQRCLAANLSDLAAMGARPAGFMLALTLPREDPLWLDEFSSTLARLAGEYAVPLIGGNIARGSLSLTLTVLGTTPHNQALRRAGARVGDDIYVSGSPGEAAAGLRGLDEGNAAELIERYEAPTPRIALGLALREVASAAIDVSDGLIADLSHIAAASGCGASIEASAIPLSDALRVASGDEALNLALAGGDDYELCFTASPDSRPAIADVAARLSLPLTRIGVMTDSDEIVVTGADGEPVRTPDGYDHFLSTPRRTPSG